MNRNALIDRVAQKTNLSKKASGEAVKAIFEAIKEELAAGGEFQMVGFGTFKTKERPAHDGVNPFNKKKYHTDAKKVPAFVPGKALKDAVAK
ncbi:MAG: HU family DNA-binding protein [Clostridia bacterium]|nr:HU family DNA-binding protein [Clostridia bacterium]